MVNLPPDITMLGKLIVSIIHILEKVALNMKYKTMLIPLGVGIISNNL